MKKIISLGIASAVCAIVAVSASADAIVAYDVTGEVSKGSEVTIVVKATADFDSVVGAIEVAGLEVKDVVNAKEAPLFKYDETTGALGFGSVGGKLASAGDTVLEVKAVVTANAGEKISFAIKGNTEKEVAKLPTTALTVEVKGASTSSGNSNSGNSSTSSEGNNGGATNPPTGVALAVVPAVLAAAGVIVAKKRK